MFAHRVADAKYEPDDDDPKPITHVTVPSCHYFLVKARVYAYGRPCGCICCYGAKQMR